MNEGCILTLPPERATPDRAPVWTSRSSARSGAVRSVPPLLAWWQCRAPMNNKAAALRLNLPGWGEKIRSYGQDQDFRDRQGLSGRDYGPQSCRGGRHRGKRCRGHGGLAARDHHQTQKWLFQKGQTERFQSGHGRTEESVRALNAERSRCRAAGRQAQRTNHCRTSGGKLERAKGFEPSTLTLAT